MRASRARTQAPRMRRLALRVAGIVFFAFALLACAGLPRPPQVELAPGTATAMRPGDRAHLPGGGLLAYVGLHSDSRCPPEVACIHAGWAELDFSFEAGGHREALRLSTRAGIAPMRAGAWRIELVEVGRGASPTAHVRASNAGH